MNTQRLDHLFLASKIIEQDGIDGLESAAKLVDKQIAVAFLVAYTRRNLGSAKSYPANPEIDEKVKQLLLNNNLFEINSFQDKYRFLSSFWFTDVVFEDITYPSVEHAYQAAKSGNIEMQKKIAFMTTPEEAKLESQKPGFPIRAGWKEMKMDVMEDLIRQKFSVNNPGLAYQMYLTWDLPLKEGNTWEDTFWGEYNGEGENNLGKLLMKRRSDIVSLVQYFKNLGRRFNKIGFDNFHDKINEYLVDDEAITKKSTLIWLQTLGITY